MNTMCSITPFPSPTMNLQFLEEILYDLPPLEGVFLHWHTHGETATTAGIVSLLARRKQLLGSTTLSGASIQLLYECAVDSLRSLPGEEPHSPWLSRPLHARILRHRSSLSAAGTQVLLPPGVLVQKTVSVTLAGTLMLCSGVGLQRLTRQHLRTIAATLALRGRAVKQCTINPFTYNPVETFGMQPGMVSPFLHPCRPAGLTALVLLPWPQQCEVQGREVAISLSLWESLALPLSCLRHLVLSYARRAYPAVRIIELESEGTTHAHTDTITSQSLPAHLTVESASGPQETDKAGHYPGVAKLGSLNRLHHDENGQANDAGRA